jgi:tetratricopeptide (TPR) repeat protein
MSYYGYIYVLINPAMPGLLKIGLTTKTPEERVKELSRATGVPTSFILIYKEQFQNCYAAEKEIHNRLEIKGFRINKGREFFDAEPSDVIDIIKDIKSNENQLDNEIEGFEDNNDNQAYEYYESLAYSHYNGDNDYLQDYEEAFNYFKRAYDLNSPTAPKLLGIMKNLGQGIKENKQEALRYFKEGLKRNDTSCWFEIAMHYALYEQHGDNFIKAVNAYLESADITSPTTVEKAITIFSVANTIFKMQILAKEQFSQIISITKPFSSDIVKYYIDNSHHIDNSEIYDIALIYFDMGDISAGILLLKTYLERLIITNQLKNDALMHKSLGSVADTVLLAITLYEDDIITQETLSDFINILGNQSNELITYCNDSISIAHKSIELTNESNAILESFENNSTKMTATTETEDEIISKCKSQINDLTKIRKALSYYANDMLDEYSKHPVEIENVDSIKHNKTNKPMRKKTLSVIYAIFLASIVIFAIYALNK